MKSHGTDLVSLGAGVVFLGIAGLWLLTRFVDLGAAAWAAVVPGVLLVVGAVGIGYTVRAARQRD